MKEEFDPIQGPHGSSDSSQQSPHSPSGQYQRFGNYDLVRRIDVGGMGEVYLARQRTAFGREVAVKIIRSDLAYDITARKRFLREAEVSAHLKHEHILPLIEFSEVDGRLFLVTPYIKGGTLARRLQQGPLPLIEVYQLFSPLAQAVSYIHKRGVIHRDLKPSNVLLDLEEDSGQIYVRLIDFGIASIPGATAAPPLTTAGNEMGTVAYMAPERVNGVAAPSNDIYSLGVILYQMLTGQLPTEQNNPPIPQALAYVVRRCLMGDPADRFANVDELLQAFEYAYKSLSGVHQAIPTTASRYQTSPPPPSGPVSRPDATLFPPPMPAEQVAWQEQLFVHRAEIVPSSSSPISRPGQVFRGEDYSAPTSFLTPGGPTSRGAHKLLANETLVTGKHAVTGKAAAYGPAKGMPPRRSRSFVGFISITILTLLALVGGMSYLIFQASINATITITPQVRSVSQVFTVTASLNQHTVDARAGMMPANVLNSSQSAQINGPTTGRAGCLLFVINCKQAVSFTDVILLVEQVRPGLKGLIARDLQKQAQAAGVTQVGTIEYTDGVPSAQPDVGTVSKTVAVTFSMQGSVEGVKTKDARDLAALLLQQHLDPNYALMDQLTQIGQPVVQGINSNGDIKVAIPAAGVERYQIPDSELAYIQDHIKGMKPQDARAFISSQPGLDTKSIAIHVSYGETIPTNTQQIKVVTVDPSNLPPVKVAPIPSQ